MNSETPRQMFLKFPKMAHGIKKCTWRVYVAKFRKSLCDTFLYKYLKSINEIILKCIHVFNLLRADFKTNVLSRACNITYRFIITTAEKRKIVTFNSPEVVVR